MSNYISLLLEAEAANRRLARLFQSEEIDRASQQSISIVTADANGAARREPKQNSKMPQENRHERTPVRSRTRTVIPNTGSGATKRDLTVSSFMLALVLAGVVVAAHTDHPVFWLFIGPIPVAVLHTTRAFLRQRVIRREEPLMFSKRARLYQENLLTKTPNPIDADQHALSYAADSKDPTLSSEMHAARSSVTSVGAISRTPQ
jgi:hypothetical protein